MSVSVKDDFFEKNKHQKYKSNKIKWNAEYVGI